MTRRDYVRIAAALRAAYANHTGAGLIGAPEAESRAYSLGVGNGLWLATVNLADMLAADNPRFDRDRFFDAVDQGSDR